MIKGYSDFLFEADSVNTQINALKTEISTYEDTISAANKLVTDAVNPAAKKAAKISALKIEATTLPKIAVSKTKMAGLLSNPDAKLD
jgi:predicted  nucleic acid-binding Zn-ribbon protein